MKDVNKCRLNVSPGIEDSVHWGIEPERHSAHRLFIYLSFPGSFQNSGFFHYEHDTRHEKHYFNISSYHFMTIASPRRGFCDTSRVVKTKVNIWKLTQLSKKLSFHTAI